MKLYSSTLTGSFDITGSSSLNGTQLQFIGPINSPYVVPNTTITPTASVLNNIHISSSGIYNVNLSNMTPGVSCSMNIYYWVDLIPSNSEAQVLITIPTGSGTAATYRTLVTASSSTTWWSPIAVGTATATATKNAGSIQRRYNGLGNSAPHQIVNSPYGIYLTKTRS